MAAYTTIDDPSAYFKVQLWTGDDASSRAITFDDTDTNMQPDFVWIKPRSTTTEHNVYDSVRGATYALQAHNEEAEGTNNGYGWLSAFGSDGFTVVEGATNASRVNGNAVTYVAWCWKESTTAGFDIVSYTGNGTAGKTVSHSLSAVPDFFFLKNRSTASTNWITWGSWMANTNALYINLTNALGTSQTYLNSTTPTSSVITLGGGNDENKNTDNHILYAWKAVQGFSKFGTYKGTGSSANQGPFIYLGFKPALVITKPSSEVDAWSLWDNKRPGYNNQLHQLFPHVSSAESAGASTKAISFCSNGFKIDGSDANELNKSGDTYVYMAWAESPFVNSNGVPNNAE